MKKFILALVAVALGFSACSPESRLTGSWDLDSMAVSITEDGVTETQTVDKAFISEEMGFSAAYISFTDGGKFIVNLASADGFSFSKEFDYSAKKDQLSIVVNGKTIIVRYSIAGNVLTIFGKGEFIAAVLGGDMKESAEDISLEFKFTKK